MGLSGGEIEETIHSYHLLAQSTKENASVEIRRKINSRVYKRVLSSSHQDKSCRS